MREREEKGREKEIRECRGIIISNTLSEKAEIKINSVAPNFGQDPCLKGKHSKIKVKKQSPFLI